MKDNAVEEYIAQQPLEHQERLKAIQDLGRKLLPNAREAMKYGLPTFIGKKNIFHYGGFKNHIGFYPTPRGIQAFETLLKPYPQGKGSIQFPMAQELPISVIAKMIEYRGKQDQGV